MFPASSPSKGGDLGSFAVKSNVALDLFADEDSISAQNETRAGYEIMIWLASIGDIKPIGYSNTACGTQQVGSNSL